MKRFCGTLLLAISVLTLPAMPVQAQRARFTDATAAQLMRAEILLVDLRAPLDWQQAGVIPGALLLGPLPTDALANALASHLATGRAADRPIVLLCQEGWRSAREARALAPLLGRDVLSVNGGMNRLVAEGFAPDLP